MSNDLAMRITKMLYEAEPGLLACEPGATARAAASTANVLGSVLATVLVQKGAGTYIEVFRGMMAKVHESAQAAAKIAADMAETPEPRQ